ncbi:MAG: hypothetical protein JOY64_31795 [Alphaproteobacteria bacterium]|nr:hypothetical protein [Alphaproteobacteria bacterium]MBV8412243.1 hypothetical protein [Alphaproteobacteria bacterium]
MSLRSLAALGLVLFLCACNVPGKPSASVVNEIERRHDDMMMRGLDPGDGGSSL